MNVNVWLKVAKYKAMVRNIDDDGRNTYIPYPITESEYAKLKIAIANKEPFTWIHDILWNRIREVNAKRDIKEFNPITQNINNSSYSIVCGFWVPHVVYNGSWDCKCSEKYGCLSISFLWKMNKLLRLEISDSSKITKNMRIQYLNNLK